MSLRRKLAGGAARTALPVVLLLCPAMSQAADFDYDATGGIGESDNIKRVSEGAQDETIARLGLKFALDEQSPRLRADLVGDLAYYDYLQNTYSSEVVGNVVGSARLSLVPERVTWLFADSFGQVLVDPFTPPTPDNRENINYFSTGPDATFAFGSQTRLALGARYTDSIYERSPFDSSGLLGQVGLKRLLTSASELGVNLSYEEVKFDDSALNGDYNKSEAFINYELRGDRTQLLLDAGYTSLSRDAVNEDENGPLIRLKATRQIGAHSQLTLDAGHEFASSSSAFAGDQSSGSIGLDPSSSRQTVQPFTNEYVELNWRIIGRRTSVSLGGGWRKQDYKQSADLNQTVSSMEAGAQRDLTPALSIGLDLRYGHSDFEVAGDYSDWLGAFSLKWRVSRDAFLSLELEHYDRASDLATGDYTENRVMLSFGFGRGAPRSRLMPEYPMGGAE